MYTTPQPGDVVQCWFPQEPSTTPGPKLRPALVLGATQKNGQTYVTVAYGTSQYPNAGYRGHFCVTASDKDGWKHFLGKDTRFDLTKCIELKLDSSWFGDLAGDCRSPALLKKFKSAYFEVNR